jgi:hypothetical protein
MEEQSATDPGDDQEGRRTRPVEMTIVAEEMI